MGGGTKVLHIYADMLTRRGHDVLVVSVPESKPTTYEQFKHFLKHLRFKKNDNPTPSFFDDSIAKHKVIEQYRPIEDGDVPDADIIIATWWETAEWLNKLHSNKGKKIYFVQGHETFDYLPIERVKQTYYFPMQKIVVSQWLANIMQAEYLDATSIIVPNSIDKSQYYSTGRVRGTVPTVGFLYSNSYVKGVSDTLKAIKLIKKVIPELKVISFGSHRPEAFPEWDFTTEFYQLPEQGFIREIYCQCDIWLTASVSEGFNLTAMEAMACGTPVISTKTGWPVEAIKSYENGVLVDVNDVAALASSAIDLLTMDGNLWVNMSQAAEKTANASSWDESVTKFEQSLTALLE